MDEELLKRLEQTYSQAAADVTKKANDYFAAFARKDAEKKKLVDAGLLSKDEYAKWRKGQMLVGERWKEMRDVLAQDLTNADKIALSIINGYLPDAYATGHNYGTFLVERNSRLNTSYSLYNREAVERLVKNEPRLLPVTKWELNAPQDLRWNQQHITQQITQGILQGEGLPQVAKRLERVVGMDQRAAMRNARTALTGAQNAGRMDAYRRASDLGIPMEKEWLATMDNVTRDSHIDLDGEHVGLDEHFSNGMDYPGGSGPPEEVYNCRCTLIPRVKGKDYSKSDALRWRNEKSLGDISYDDWKATHAGRDKPKTKEQKTKEQNFTTKFDKAAWDTMLNSQTVRELDKWCYEFASRISEDERLGVRLYTGSAYTSMNRYLRGSTNNINWRYQDAIENCTDALKKGFIPKDVIVRRGVDEDALNAMLMDNRAFENIIANGDTKKYLGAVFTDKGFVSTSPVSGGGFGGEVEMVIRVPKGSQAAYVDRISKNEGEKELLIQRSQMYQVEHLEVVDGRWGDKKVRMYCNLMGGLFE